MTPGRIPATATNTPTRAETACALRRRFPGALIWQGHHTGHWWAYIPVGRPGRLIEATYPAELADLLDQVWRSRPSPGASPATGLRRSPYALLKRGNR